MGGLLLSAALVLLAACGSAPPRVAADRLPERASSMAFAPGASAALPTGVHPQLGANSRAFVQDNLWTDGADQYAVWIDPHGRPVVGKHSAGTWTHTDLSAVAGNPLASPTPDDPHNVYVIAVDADGYIHVAGNMHRTTLRYVRSERPRDITSWVTGRMVGRDESAMTYPGFVQRLDGSLLFFYRDGGAGHGSILVNELPVGGDRWRRLTTLVDGKTSGESPYLQHVAVDRQSGALHVMYVWRESPDASTNTDLSYATSDDGGRTWRSSDGDALPLPITHAGSDVVIDAASSSGLSNAGGLEVDSSGRPHAAVLLNDRGVTNSVQHVWHDGSAWQRVDTGVRSPGRIRPAVATTAGGDVYVVHGQRRSDGSTTVWLLDVTPGRDGGRDVALSEIAPARWEPVFDTRALSEHGVLSLLTPGAPDTCEPAPDTARCAPAAVVSFDLAALTATAAPRSFEQICPATSRGTFTDTRGHPHEPAIECLVHHGVAVGDADRRYRPDRTLSRAQLSTFVVRLITASGGALPRPRDAFVDDDRSAHERSINQLAAAGIVTVGPDRRFRPSDPVTRAQLTSLLTGAVRYRGADLSGSGRDHFGDDDGTVHEASINLAADYGLVAPATAFFGARGSTRGQTATLLARSLALLAEQGFGPTA